MDKTPIGATTAAPTPAAITEQQDALTRRALITHEELSVETLSLARDHAILFRAETSDEKIKERLWRAASEFEAARKILAANLRKAAKGVA